MMTPSSERKWSKGERSDFYRQKDVERKRYKAALEEIAADTNTDLWTRQTARIALKADKP